MKRNATSSLGALHPVLFLLLVYTVSIVLAFFVCRTVYLCLHADGVSTGGKMVKLEPLTAAK